MMDAAGFRAQFQVFGRRAYLNAGTEGPVPTAAVEAVKARVDADCADGRAGRDYFDTIMALAAAARAGYAAVLGAEPNEVALTGSTTDGLNTVIGGLTFSAGDEIVTSDEEHPGLLAPLRLAARRRGVTVRMVPFDQLSSAAGPATRLVACSHVSWVTGKLADVAGLVAGGVPVLLDAAQALGAIPVDVHALGVDFYAASGQKWLCGPEGSGCLYVRPDRLDELEPPWPGYATLGGEIKSLDSPLADGTGRLDVGFPTAIRSAWACASLEVLGGAGWDWVHERAASLAESLAQRLAAAGLAVAPRGRTTLVSWRASEPEAEVARLADAGFVIRSIPSSGLLRASVGAWSSEDELERLALAAGSVTI
jgi:L-cysteine/cystine lyase